jgi:hypothetical protein
MLECYSMHIGSTWLMIDVAYRLRSIYGGASFDLPLLVSPDQPPNRLVMEELSYDRNQLVVEADSLQALLNSEQRVVFDTVLGAVSRNTALRLSLCRVMVAREKPFFGTLLWPISGHKATLC